MSMITVELGEDGTHEYASGITAGEVILNVHGKRSGAVAAVIDGVERDFSYVLDSDCSLEPINGESEDCLLYTSPSPRDQRGSRMPSSA